MERRYRVGELAALSGVSVRTLHHYDRIGLLRPSGYSEGGQRQYSQQDLLCLQQILTLRYLGFPLARIRELLALPAFDLAASMRIQRGALRDRIADLERIEAALGALLDHHARDGTWGWELVADASAAVRDGIVLKGADMDRYYTPEQMREWEELRESFPDEERLAIEQGWTELLAEVRASRNLDPVSPRAQELAERWDRMMERTQSAYRGHERLWEAIGENYRQGNFAQLEGAPQEEDMAFIERAKAARKGGG